MDTFCAENERALARALSRKAAGDTSWEGEIATCRLCLAENDADLLAAAKALVEAERAHHYAYMQEDAA